MAGRICGLRRCPELKLHQSTQLDELSRSRIPSMLVRACNPFAKLSPPPAKKIGLKPEYSKLWWLRHFFRAILASIFLSRTFPRRMQTRPPGHSRISAAPILHQFYRNHNKPGGDKTRTQKLPKYEPPATQSTNPLCHKP